MDLRFDGRTAFLFAEQKINLHKAGYEVSPHANRPMPGSADLCLIVKTPLDVIEAELQTSGVSVELGPVERTGALGKIHSIYLRDPDKNLIELSVYV